MYPFKRLDAEDASDFKEEDISSDIVVSGHVSVMEAVEYEYRHPRSGETLPRGGYVYRPDRLGIPACMARTGKREDRSCDFNATWTFFLNSAFN